MRTFVLATALFLATTTFARADDKDKPKPNCHALDDAGATIDETIATSVMDCTSKLFKLVKQAKCGDPAKTGKTVDYKQVFDAGSTAGKAIAQKTYCTKKDLKK